MSKRRYQITTYQGKRVNRISKHTMNAVNDVLQKSKYFGREKGDFTLVQGSYNGGGVKQSAGTHDGGGAIDVTAFNINNRVKVFRMAGWRFWHRRAIRGVWAAHGHGILAGDGSVSAGAHRQRIAYANGRDGLAGNRRDPDWRPDRYDIRPILSTERGGGVGTFYVRKSGTAYRSQPGYKCGRIRGRAKKNQKVRIVLWVWVHNPKTGRRRRYAWTDHGNWFVDTAISRKKS